MLLALILIPLLGGAVAAVAESWGRLWPGRVAFLVLLAELALGAMLWGGAPSAPGPWLAEEVWPWIPRFGISFHLALDGLSLVLVLLTAFLGVMAVAASWREVSTRPGFYYLNLLWTLAGVVGVFLAIDLFLFFIFWEIMLVPMYFLIAIWGHEQRGYAALKFFIFTQASGLLMLISIVALALVHAQTSGVFTFDYPQLLADAMPEGAATWIMLGFFIAFAVKLPMVPFHTWLADAHTQAPTGASIILAGILLKAGAYGLIRFVVPLFPGAVAELAPLATGLGVAGILYGALLAFAQTDLKRMVAYSSVSHMGFVLLGVFAWNAIALQGAVMQLIAHGVSTGALFLLAGAIQHRLHTRDMGRMGGFWAYAPRMGALGLFFAVASLGLPGLANFLGEFLVLLGSFRVAPIPTAVAATGLVLAAVYALALVQRVFHGPPHPFADGLPDLDGRERGALGVMAVTLVVLGLFPQPVLDLTGPAIESMRQFAAVLAPPLAESEWRVLP